MAEVTVTEPQLADALKGLVVTVEDGEEGTEGKLRHPSGIARDVFYLVSKEPQPIDAEDNEIAALTVIVDQLEHLQTPTVRRVIRYLSDRYGTSG